MPDSNTIAYAYPRELTSYLTDRWSETLPQSDILEGILAACFQASLLVDEGRNVAFRAIVVDPTDVQSDKGPPSDLHVLEFDEALPFDATSLRRLSAAATFARTLIGLTITDSHEVQIWGLINQGSRWLHDVVGGRGGGPELPDAMIVHVVAAGSIEVRHGPVVLARLENGRISGDRFDVFGASWLHNDFFPLQDALDSVHGDERTAASARGESWAIPDRDLTRLIGEQMVKRMVSLMRRGRHGGTLLFVPSDAVKDGRDVYLDIKYRFGKSSAQNRFFELLLKILRRLAILGAENGQSYTEWSDFQSMSDNQLVQYDEAWLELANLLAALAAVDGALVLDKHMQILGFGAEISGQLAPVNLVHQALDLDASITEQMSSINEGTRHRSAYRLVDALPDTLAIVVSQDGGARFVKSYNDKVVYWEHE